MKKRAAHNKETQQSFNHDHFQINSTAKKKLKFRRGKKLREENILKYIMENSPSLAPWKREVLRIVCEINQYLYPQMHTQVMNEGWACFWHYHLMNDLEDGGYLPEGAMFEFLSSHTGVVAKPAYNSPYY